MQQLFKTNSKDIPGLMDCTLRKMRLKACAYLMNSWLGRLNETHYKVDERACGHLAWMIIMTLIEKLIEEIDLITLDLRKSKPIVCECTRLYQKLEQSGTTLNFETIFKHIAIDCEYIPGCTLFHQQHGENRLKLYSEVHEIPETYVVLPPPNNKSCPLCIFIAYEQNKNNSIHSKHWLSLVENIWNNEMPSLRACCYQCLKLLTMKEVGKQCSKCQYMEGIVWNNHDFWSSRKYPDKNNLETDCIVNETRIWKYDIIFGIRVEMGKIMRQGIENEKHYCTLRKMRMVNTMLRVIYHLGKPDLTMCREKYLMENVARVEIYMSSLRFQWDTYISESEEQPTECMCSAPIKHLNKVVNYFWKTKHKKLESYRKLLLEFSYKADSFLSKKMEGCPLNFTLQNEKRFSDFISVKQFFSDFVAVFCADDKLLMDSFHIEPQNVDEDFSDAFEHLFVK